MISLVFGLTRCAPLANSVSKSAFHRQKESLVAMESAGADASEAPSSLPLKTRVISLIEEAEAKKAEAESKRRSSKNEAKPAAPSEFEYLQALVYEELKQFRESAEGKVRVTLPSLDGYQSGEIVVKLGLTSARLLELGLTEISFRLSADPAFKNEYLLETTGDAEREVLRQIQEHAKDVIIVLKQQRSASATEGADEAKRGKTPGTAPVAGMKRSELARPRGIAGK